MIKLILGDCLEVMPTLKSGSVDLVLTDPAYESMLRWEGIGTTARMGMGKKGSGSDNLKDKFFDVIKNEDLPDMIQEFHRLLKNERHAYVMCDWETIKMLHYFAITEGVFKPVGYGGMFESCKPLFVDNGEHLEHGIREVLTNWLRDYTSGLMANDVAFQEVDFSAKALDLLGALGSVTDSLEDAMLMWDKEIAGMGYTYRTQYELILMLWKGKKRRLNDLSTTDVLRYRKPWGKARIFPTQKSVALMEKLILQSTQPWETVIDPFMGGAGTTAIACINTERDFIGIEKNPETFAQAQAVIDEYHSTIHVPADKLEQIMMPLTSG